MALKVGELFGVLKLDDKDFNQGVDRAEHRFGGLASGVAKGGLLIAGALGGIGVAAGSMAAGFEADMANVGTLLGEQGSARVKELEQDVKRLSMETGKPLDDLAAGLYQITSAFGDTADSAKLLEIAAKSSTAGLATTQDAVNLLSAVTKGYGDTSATAVSKASDLAFQTVKLGQTTFPELAASMGQAIPLAATLKVKQEELFGAMATLTGVTGGTSEVTTQLRGAFQALINSNPKMLAQLDKIGFSTGTAAVESLGLQGTLDALATSVGGDTQQLAEMFGSVEALGAVLALTGPQADDFKNKTLAMGDAVGATDEAFKIQQKTVAATFERVKASIGVLLVNLGDKLLPAFKVVLDWVLDNWDQIADVIDGVFKTVGDVITYLIANVWPGLLGAFKFFADTILPIVVAAFQILIEDVIPTLVDVFSGVANDTGPMLAGAFDFIANTVIPAIAAAFSFLAEDVVPVLQAVFEAIVGWVADNWPTISSVVEQVAGAIGSAFEVIVNIIHAAWPVIEAIASVLFPLLGAAATILLNAIDLTFKLIGGIWQTAADVAGVVVGAIKGAWDGMTGFFKGLWDGIGGAIKVGINAVIGMVNGLIRFLNGIQIHIPEIGVGPVHTPAFDWWGLQLKRIPYLAGGVRDFSGGLAMVGEQGPELVRLPRGADVFSQAETAAMLAGGGGSSMSVSFGDIIVSVPSDAPAGLGRRIAQEILDIVGNGIQEESARFPNRPGLAT